MTALDIYKKLTGYGVPAGDAKILAAVAGAESGYNPGAENITSREASIGLFQINMKAHYDKLARWTQSKDPEVWREWLKDPEHNIFAASEVYKSQGLGAWTAYTTGAYIPFLNRLDKITIAEPDLKPKTSKSQVTVGSFSGTVAGIAILVLAVVVGLVLIMGGMRNAQA